MQQRIEDPKPEDIQQLAQQLIVAEALVRDVTGSALVEGVEDLDLLQEVVDSATLSADQTYEWQCLGLALGRVFASEMPGMDWAIVEDEYGRDPALRYEQTTLLVFPLTMFSKRIEDGAEIDVRHLYEGVVHHIERLKTEVR